MTNKSTKRALLTSSVSLLLCFAMLLGTTFAWFTDSVASANNIIKAGNLDVTLHYADGTEEVPAEDSNDWADASATKIFTYENWEPGYTDVKHIKIGNAGSLALKYQFNIAAESGVSELADVIDVYFMDPAIKVANRTALSDSNKVGTLTQVLGGMPKNASGTLEAGKSDMVTIALKMQESAGNEYQNATFGKFSVQVVATQLNAESDSFGSDYDEDAFVADEYVKTADEMIDAIENAGQGEVIGLMNNIKIDPANMSNAYGTTGINIKNGQTLDGNGHTLDIKGAGGTWDSGINTTGGTIRNLTVTGSFRGIFINHNSTYSEPVILENVIIDGTTYTISCDQGMNQNLLAKKSTFNGWTSFAATLGKAEFVDCDFGEGNGYAYCRPYAPTTFVGCDFEAGFEMDTRAAVTFENCTIGGVALTADNLATLVTSNIVNATVK